MFVKEESVGMPVEKAECLFNHNFFFLKKNGAGLFYNPHTHETTNLAKSVATITFSFLLCCMRYW